MVERKKRCPFSYFISIPPVITSASQFGSRSQWQVQPRQSDDYIYTMEYYSAIKRTAFESVLMSFMNLEPIIQNEVSQKEKDKYRILMNIYGI